MCLIPVRIPIVVCFSVKIHTKVETNMVGVERIKEYQESLSYFYHNIGP